MSIPQVQFGNREVDLPDLLRLIHLCGPAGEAEAEPDTVYLRCEREQFTRAELLEVVQIIARVQPDECTLQDGELRLWWD